MWLLTIRISWSKSPQWGLDVGSLASSALVELGPTWRFATSWFSYTIPRWEHPAVFVPPLPAALSSFHAIHPSHSIASIIYTASRADFLHGAFVAYRLRCCKLLQEFSDSRLLLNSVSFSSLAWADITGCVPKAEPTTSDPSRPMLTSIAELVTCPRTAELQNAIICCAHKLIPAASTDPR